LHRAFLFLSYGLGSSQCVRNAAKGVTDLIP
jgi:hypothetical protein